MADYPISPVSFTDVRLEDRFWAPRLEKNRTVTLPAVLQRCEDFGRVDNFRKAAARLAGRPTGPYVGVHPGNDTDLYKAIEGASFTLAQSHDPALDAKIDELIAAIAAAQEPDGYLYTVRTIDPDNVLDDSGSARWSNLVMSHELYNCGHLYEAACAHAQATGKRTLLDIARRSARLIGSVFGPDGRHDVPGHQIIESGLAGLYRLTGERGYLELARFFLDGRGRHEGRKLYMYEENPCYSQDHLPVLEQSEAVGHAVRAVYMYSGMADVAALLPDSDYSDAIRRIWRSVVDTKLYLTGGIGARRRGEAFGDPYELPNATGYSETCAAIGSVKWNHRLFLLTGEACYVDVLEQTLYNGLLSGVSLSGSEFFYPNPLESDGRFAFNHGSATRQRWFDVSCCPTNLSRFFPSLPGYLYATKDDALYVNLFASSTARLEVSGVPLTIAQQTDYPWSSGVRLFVNPERRARFTLRIRIPGWARERIMGGALYRYEHPSAAVPAIRINGAAAELDEQDGYAVIDREWGANDTLELSLPMPVRKVVCDARVEANRGKAAVQRGPIVYCVEAPDATVPFDSLRLGDESSLEARWDGERLGGVVAVRGAGFTAIPYFAWSNRGPARMAVWLPSA